MKILYYHTQEYFKGLLIENNAVKTGLELNVIKLTESEGTDIESILNNNISEFKHRCLSIYRDAFVIHNNTYNICLSCGDYYKNDKKYFLNERGIEAIKKIKYNLL